MGTPTYRSCAAAGSRAVAISSHSTVGPEVCFGGLTCETVGWAEATAGPVFLTRLLDAQAARCAPFQVFFPLTFSNTLGAGHPQVTVTALGGRRQSPDSAP